MLMHHPMATGKLFKTASVVVPDTTVSLGQYFPTTHTDTQTQTSKVKTI